MLGVENRYSCRYELGLGVCTDQSMLRKERLVTFRKKSMVIVSVRVRLRVTYRHHQVP